MVRSPGRRKEARGRMLSGFRGYESVSSTGECCRVKRRCTSSREVTPAVGGLAASPAAKRRWEGGSAVKFPSEIAGAKY